MRGVTPREVSIHHVKEPPSVSLGARFTIRACFILTVDGITVKKTRPTGYVFDAVTEKEAEKEVTFFKDTAITYYVP